MNEEIVLKRYKAYVWTLRMDDDVKEVTTPEGKATSEIRNLINDGYRIVKRAPIQADDQ